MSNKQFFFELAQKMGNAKKNAEVVDIMLKKYRQVGTFNKYMSDVKTIFMDKFAVVDTKWLKRYGDLKAKYASPKPMIFDTIDAILLGGVQKKLDQFYRQLKGKSQDLMNQADAYLLSDLSKLGSPFGKQLEGFTRPDHIITEYKSQCRQSLSEKMEGGMLNLDGKLQILYDELVLRMMDIPDWKAKCLAFLAATGLRCADCMYATFEKSEHPFYIKLTRYVKNKNLMAQPVEKPVLLPYEILKELQENIINDLKGTFSLNYMSLSPIMITQRINQPLNNYLRDWVEHSHEDIKNALGDHVTVHRLREIFLSTALGVFESKGSLVNSAKKMLNHSGDELGELAHYIGRKFNDKPIKLKGLEEGTVLYVY